MRNIIILILSHSFFFSNSFALGLREIRRRPALRSSTFQLAEPTAIGDRSTLKQSATPNYTHTHTLIQILKFTLTHTTHTHTYYTRTYKQDHDLLLGDTSPTPPLTTSS